MSDFIEKHLGSHKRLGTFLFLVTVGLSVPITLSLLSQKQDIRQRASTTSSIGTNIANSNCTVDSNDLAITPDEQLMVDKINAYRQQNGLPPYALSLNLTRSAAWYARDMADKNFRVNYPSQMAQHLDSTGRGHQARISGCGYSASQLVSENTVWDGTSVESAFQRWVESPGHKANMLDTGRTAIGIAKTVANDPQYGNLISYYVTDFGAVSDGGNIPRINPTAVPVPPTSTPMPVITRVHITDFPATTGNPLPTAGANDGILKLAINLPGIGSEENTAPISGVLAEIYLINPSSNSDEAIHIRAPLEYKNGAFRGEGPVPAGTYTMKIATANSLKYTLPVTVQITAGQTTNLEAFNLTTGDINFDNVLDIQDYNTLITCISESIYCTGANKIYTDLNLDGKVDEKDLNIFYSALANRQGD